MSDNRQTINCLALREVGVVLAGEEAIPIPADDTLDITAYSVSLVISYNIEVVPGVDVEEEALHFVLSTTTGSTPRAWIEVAYLLSQRTASGTSHRRLFYTFVRPSKISPAKKTREEKPLSPLVVASRLSFSAGRLFLPVLLLAAVGFRCLDTDNDALYPDRDQRGLCPAQGQGQEAPQEGGSGYRGCDPGGYF